MFITYPSDSYRRLALALIGLLIVAACSPPTGTSPGDADAPEDAPDPRGEILSFACQACHTLTPGGQHQIGPNLSGFLGRQAGTAEGFGFSDELRNSGIVWTEAELDRWLADPGGFLPGTTMTFTGYQSPEDRAALIDYLVEATAD